MVDLCPVFKWWFENRTENRTEKKPVYGPKCPVLKWSHKSHDLTNHLNTGHPHRRYADESGIKVLGIQMVTLIKNF